MSEKEYALGVIGAGSYGTALALSTASKGIPVMLWCRDPDTAKKLQTQRENSKYLPGIRFSDFLDVTSDLKELMDCCRDLLIVVPSHTFAGVLNSVKSYLKPEHRIAWATKGMDLESGKLLSEVAENILGSNVPMAALSGPTFAVELARGLPTAIAVAGTDEKFNKDFIELMHTKTFRIYESSDLLGLQLGGSIKNVIAIGAGLSDGLGFGANARTALISRGLAEMIRFGVAFGATEKAFMGLSGLGDLILTCTDNQSRNRRFGVLLGKGNSCKEALKSIGQVVEGYTMCKIMKRLSTELDVQMPICNEVYEIIYNGKPGLEAAKSLLGRSLKTE